jgi:hypothetical protein
LTVLETVSFFAAFVLVSFAVIRVTFVVVADFLAAGFLSFVAKVVLSQIK